MGKLESPNQMGNKGDMDKEVAGPSGGKLISPSQFDGKGEAGTAPSNNTSGKITSPSYETNDKESKGHGDGRSAKGNDGVKGAPAAFGR